jgi:hypothetical protein
MRAQIKLCARYCNPNWVAAVAPMGHDARPVHLSLGPLEFSDGPGLRNFEERPRMSSERDTFRRKADEAKQRAAQASEPFMRSAYEKVAEHSMLLARLESLLGDEESNEDGVASQDLDE